MERSANATMLAALRAVRLYQATEPWTLEMQLEWLRITHADRPEPRSLMDIVREAIAAGEGAA